MDKVNPAYQLFTGIGNHGMENAMAQISLCLQQSSDTYKLSQ